MNETDATDGTRQRDLTWRGRSFSAFKGENVDLWFHDGDVQARVIHDRVTGTWCAIVDGTDAELRGLICGRTGVLPNDWREKAELVLDQALTASQRPR